MCEEKKELIVWIDSDSKISGYTNEFNINIGNIPFCGKYIRVELLKAYIQYNTLDLTAGFTKSIPYISFIKIF